MINILAQLLLENTVYVMEIHQETSIRMINIF